MFETVIRIYAVGLLLTAVHQLIFIVRGARSRFSVGDRTIDTTHLGAIATAILWPIYWPFRFTVAVVGLDRIARAAHRWLEKRGGSLEHRRTETSEGSKDAP